MSCAQLANKQDSMRANDAKKAHQQLAYVNASQSKHLLVSDRVRQYANRARPPDLVNRPLSATCVLATNPLFADAVCRNNSEAAQPSASDLDANIEPHASTNPTHPQPSCIVATPNKRKADEVLVARAKIPRILTPRLTTRLAARFPHLVPEHQGRDG